MGRIPGWWSTPLTPQPVHSLNVIHSPARVALLFPASPPAAGLRPHPCWSPASALTSHRRRPPSAPPQPPASAGTPTAAGLRPHLPLPRPLIPSPVLIRKEKWQIERSGSGQSTPLPRSRSCSRRATRTRPSSSVSSACSPPAASSPSTQPMAIGGGTR